MSKEMKIYKCHVCGIFHKDKWSAFCSNDCANVTSRIKENCVVCGEKIGKSYNNYINRGNYCIPCSGKCHNKQFARNVDYKNIMEQLIQKLSTENASQNL